MGRKSRAARVVQANRLRHLNKIVEVEPQHDCDNELEALVEEHAPMQQQRPHWHLPAPKQHELYKRPRLGVPQFGTSERTLFAGRKLRREVASAPGQTSIMKIFRPNISDCLAVGDLPEGPAPAGSGKMFQRTVN